MNKNFVKLITELNENSHLKLTAINRSHVINGLLYVKQLNAFASEHPSKFKFIKAQLNEQLDRLKQSPGKPQLDKTRPDGSKTNASTGLGNLSDIADRAVWVQKNKWMSSKQALGWAVGMNQPELRGLSNQQRFDVNWKVVSSNGAAAKKIEPAVWKKEFKKLAQEKTEKNIHNYLKSESKHWKGFDFNVKELTAELVREDYAGLNPAARFAARNQIKSTPEDKEKILNNMRNHSGYTEK